MSYVYPLQLSENTNMDSLQELFQHISPTPQSIFLGISAEDSSIVYYKISDGVVAPKEVKD